MKTSDLFIIYHLVFDAESTFFNHHRDLYAYWRSPVLAPPAAPLRRAEHRTHSGPSSRLHSCHDMEIKKQLDTYVKALM